jgi:hypothetical protein
MKTASKVTLLAIIIALALIGLSSLLPTDVPSLFNLIILVSVVLALGIVLGLDCYRGRKAPSRPETP